MRKTFSTVNTTKESWDTIIGQAVGRGYFTIDEKAWAADMGESPISEIIGKDVDFEIDATELYESNLGDHARAWVKGKPETEKLVKLDVLFMGAVECDDMKSARKYYNKIQRWREK